MRKFFPIGCALLVALALSGCGGTGEDALTLMGKSSDLQKPYMREIFDHFKETTGKDLDILAIEDAEYETTALDLLQKGELPDIFLHFHNADLNRFDVAENFCYLNDEAWVNDLTDSAKAYCTDADGNLLGLPFWESSVSGCYYNTKLLKGLGAPATQEDFDGLCNALLRKGITPICWPADGCSWMAQFGLDPIFADDPALLQSLNRNEITYAEIPAVTNMVQWIADAADQGWFGDDFLKTGWDDISPALSSGKAAMTFIWDTWFYTDFKPGNYTVDDFALMPVFMNTTPGGTYEGGNLNMMMVNKKSDKKDLALEFLSFCATPENYNVAFSGISTVSVFKGQTTNIQSAMVTNAMQSIAAHERVSTASTKIIGYSAENTVAALNRLLRKNISVAQCIASMDSDRINAAASLGTPGF